MPNTVNQGSDVNIPDAGNASSVTPKLESVEGVLPKQEEENKSHALMDVEPHPYENDPNIKREYDDFDQYRYVPLSSFLNKDREVLFADPERSTSDRTYWITGREYSDIYKEKMGEIPTVEHMDNIPSIIQNNEGNYFPKATLESNCRVSSKIPKNRQWPEKCRIAREILEDNGLSGKTYSGMVKQADGTYNLPLHKRLVETATGMRRQQRQHSHEKHAGLENQNLLVIKPNGTIYSFDMKTDDKRANFSVKELQKAEGGKLFLRSERSNGYHSINYLNERDGENGAQKRYNSQLGRDTNANQNLPEVGVLLNGTLYDVNAILRNSDANPTLAEALQSGRKEIAHLVRLRSPKGGYWTPEYMKDNNPVEFNRLMDKHGINKEIGYHKYTSREREKHRNEAPKALIDTGQSFLESDQSVRLTLGPNETIASKYGPDKILVTNADKYGNPTGFYNQLGDAAKDLNRIHRLALRGIHTTADGQHKPELANINLSQLGQSRLLNEGQRSNARRYDDRPRQKSAALSY